MVKLVLFLVFALGLGVFSFQNTAVVHVRFLGWTSQDVSLALIIIASASVGVLLALLVSLPTHHRRHRRLRAAERELEDLRQRSTAESSTE